MPTGPGVALNDEINVPVRQADWVTGSYEPPVSSVTIASQVLCQI